MSCAAGAPVEPLPEGFGIALDRRVRVLENGTALLGGTPTRLVRLSAPGARQLARWRAGEVSRDRAARTLARRLVNARLAHPRPPARAIPGAAIAVVVPVRDRAAQLDRCLRALDAPESVVIVVDDGSRAAAEIARVARRHGAELVRHDRSRGASAARNTGLARTTAPYVAFVDSDCLPSAGWLERLSAHLADPTVAAAAPRIVGDVATCATWIGHFECDRSPLDMGPNEGAIVPLTRLPYAPSAAVIVRRAAVAGGFDESMSIGEDIDLVWRMIQAGWSVRYDPSVSVVHDHRDRLLPWLRRRFVYGTSAAPLARRHAGAMPVAVLTPWSAAVCSLLLAGRPRSALLTTVAATAHVHRRLARRSPGLPECARMVLSGVGWSGWSLAVAATRSWLPVTAVMAARSKRARRVLLFASVLPRALELRRAARSLPLPVAVVASAFDDAAYAAGLWWGCLREHTVAPLLPQFGGQQRNLRWRARRG